MTIEMRNCLKRLTSMYVGLCSVEPGDDEYPQFSEEMERFGIVAEDLEAWSVSDFKSRRPPTEAQLRGMLGYCKKWDIMSRNTEMRFKAVELREFETAINDFVFLGSQR